MVLDGLSDVAKLRTHKRKRFSSYDRTGGNRDFLEVPAGETATLAEMNGAGCVKHIWVTIRTDEEWYLRKLVLRMHWDGEDSRVNYLEMSRDGISEIKSLSLNEKLSHEQAVDLIRHLTN